MQYPTIIQLAIAHIQALAGKLWTDYNAHDPGITILEVLGFVITDLGYRTNYKLKDILAQDLNASDFRDIKNFYTACKILPNRPLNENDFRKLMIDVEVVEELEGIEEKIYAGVKNAWIEQATDAEQEIFVNKNKSELSLDEVPGVTEQESYFVKVFIQYTTRV